MVSIKFSGNILVVGDLMLDCYIEGSVDRISPEAPVPVVRRVSDRSVPGGAANLAMNLSALGIQTTLVGVMGSDDSALVLSDLLNSSGINLKTVVSEAPTTTKTRVLSGSHQLLRLDSDCHCTESENDSVFEMFLKYLPAVDLVLMSDYAKGAVANPERIIAACIDSGVPIFVDPKNEDLSVYSGATLLKPNIHEFKKYCSYVDSDDDSGFFEAGNKLVNVLGIDKLLVTRGEKGMTLFFQDNEEFSTSEVSRNVYDVTGAGDTVFSVIGASFVSNKSDFEAMRIASVAACLAVENVGTKVLSIDELNQRMNMRGRKAAKVCYSVGELSSSISMEKKMGKKIVFTNGCFDILHSGHVSYLEEAADQGDILVVGVNSDSSVKRLKGDHRPVNSTNQRVKVLSGLESVDYIISFDDDTPLNLIQVLLPDILVKGGDYTSEDIVGANLVVENGGSIVVASFVENQSTSGIIDKIMRDRNNDKLS
jgi:D-beta-D-heptose 7-phosphate kinase / D-beta-D-heptose 1-phosphate adenosyltransferase